MYIYIYVYIHIVLPDPNLPVSYFFFNLSKNQQKELQHLPFPISNLRINLPMCSMVFLHFSHGFSAGLGFDLAVGAQHPLPRGSHHLGRRHPPEAAGGPNDDLQGVGGQGGSTSASWGDHRGWPPAIGCWEVFFRKIFGFSYGVGTCVGHGVVYALRYFGRIIFWYHL